MIRLKVLNGKAEGTLLESPLPSITIGRASTNTLVIPELNVSGNHGLITVDEHNNYIYKDLNSTNGSIIQRGDRLIPLDTGEKEIILQDGDIILIGGENPVKILCKLIPDREHSKIFATRSIKDVDRIKTNLTKDPINLSILYSIQQKLSAELNIDQVLETIGEAIFELIPKATHIMIVLKEEDKRFEPVLFRSRTSGKGFKEKPKISRTVFSKVIKEKEAILAAYAPVDIGDSESIIGAHILSTMGVPLWKGDEIIGVLQVDNRDKPGMFDERDLELLTIFAGQASLSIVNARLFHKLKLAEQRLRKENIYLKSTEKRRIFQGIIGESPAMKQLFSQLEKVINTRVTVLIEGETGTGKELIASTIHYQSNRKDRLFVVQNCAALPENLLESELFGYKKGAFTGATSDKRGLFEIADGGTLFLDEIGELPLSLQGKLLRVLQEGEIRPLGAEKSVYVDVRIVAATNKNLEEEVKAGRFREDLYYRLKVFPIRVPPLRERRTDIPLLVNYFIEKYSKEYGKEIGGINDEAMRLLMIYNWPGNVRELENEIQRLVIQLEPAEIITPQHLSPKITSATVPYLKLKPKKGSLKDMMEEVEKWILIETLKECNWNKTQTAKVLGLTREGLHKKLAKYGI